MTLNEFNDYCASLAHTTHVVQWGGAHVWKVAGKVFTVGGWNGKDKTSEDNIAVSFKCSQIAFETMKGAGGVRPAPYLASRGMKWLQRTHEDAISDDELKGYIVDSYKLVASGLTKKLQRELGLLV